MKRIDLSLIIACYNEEKLLHDSVASILRVLENTKLTYELIFVDDKSHDKTVDVIKKLLKTSSHFHAIYHTVNKGRGKSVRDGLSIASGTVAAYIDIDLEISPVYIPGFVSRILNKESDVITGLRVYREGLSSLHRAVLSRGYSWLVQYTLNIPLKDTETGYKFFNRKKILPILAKTKNYGWFWDTEIMTYAYYHGLSVREEPVLFIRRFDKHSSVRLVHDTFEYLVNLLTFRKKLLKQKLKAK